MALATTPSLANAQASVQSRVFIAYRQTACTFDILQFVGERLKTINGVVIGNAVWAPGIFFTIPDTFDKALLLTTNKDTGVFHPHQKWIECHTVLHFNKEPLVNKQVLPEVPVMPPVLLPIPALPPRLEFFSHTGNPGPYQTATEAGYDVTNAEHRRKKEEYKDEKLQRNIFKTLFFLNNSFHKLETRLLVPDEGMPTNSTIYRALDNASTDWGTRMQTSMVCVTRNRWLANFISAHVEMYNYFVSLHNAMIVQAKLKVEGRGSEGANLLDKIKKSREEFNQKISAEISRIGDQVGDITSSNALDRSSQAQSMLSGLKSHEQRLNSILMELSHLELPPDSVRTSSELRTMKPLYHEMNPLVRLETIWRPLWTEQLARSFYKPLSSVIAIQANYSSNKTGPLMFYTFALVADSTWYKVASRQLDNDLMARGVSHLPIPLYHRENYNDVYGVFRQVRTKFNVATRVTIDDVLVVGKRRKEREGEEEETVET